MSILSAVTVALLLSWNGSTYSGYSVVASICAPF